MIFIISHLNRLPCDPKPGMQGDELRKSFPEGALKLIAENEARLFAAFSDSYVNGWEWSSGPPSLTTYKMYVPRSPSF